MPRIPIPSKLKKVPEGSSEVLEMPYETIIEKADITESSTLETKPDVTPKIEETPEVSGLKEEIPDQSPPKEEMPSDFNMENTVKIGGKLFEIQPTKLKYFRNKTTSCYGYLKAIPLTEFLTYDKGILDPKKDADQLLYDFLVAAFDDPEFVRDNYDEITADEIEQVIKIFGRINHIDEKEEAARKNREAQAAKR